MPDWRSYIRPHLAALRLSPMRENEIIDEIAQHLDDRWRELTAGGATEEEALRVALAQLRDDTLRQNLASLRQAQQPPSMTPFASTGRWVSDIRRDVRYGVRMFRRRPSSMVGAVMALAVGIGVNTAMFTAYHSFIARPVDAREPARVANVALIRASGTPTPMFRASDYAAYRDSVPAFSELIAFSLDRLTFSNTGQRVAASADDGTPLRRRRPLSSGGGNADLLRVAVVSENYFAAMGVTVIAGRAFDSMTHDELAANPVVLVSENDWRSRLGSDPAILGRTVYLNGAAFTVAGITPHDFIGTAVAVPAFWLPLSLEPLVHPANDWLVDSAPACCRLFGRLAPGATFDQAATQVTTVARRLDEQSNRTNPAEAPPSAIVWRASPFPLPLERYGGLRLSILLTMCAGVMVLAVACANVGSLQLARARSREDELRTRFSLGATRTRVIRQLLTESAIVGLVAGTAAFFVTWATLRIAVVWAAGVLPAEDGVFVFNVSPDMTVFGYVLGISLAAGVLFGVMPAFESSRAALMAGARGGTASGRARRFQDLLVIVQVSFALVLLIAGGVLIQSAMHALSLDPGYDAAHTLDVDVQVPEAAGYTDTHRRAVRDELRAKIAAVPGVVAVTIARMPADGSFTTSVSVDGAIGERDGGHPSMRYRYVEPSYFQTLGIPVVRGRVFSSAGDGAAHAVVLSRAAAAALWPGQDPLARTLTLGPIDERPHPAGEIVPTSVHQVVGLVGDTRGTTFDGSDALQIYLPLPDERPLDRPFLVRVSSAPSAVATDIDAVMGGADPDVVATLSVVGDILRLSPPVFVSGVSAVVASFVGAIALLLALMGIYGTVSYIVVLRTREIGIRLAIGAEGRDVLGLIVRESFRPVIRGLVVGASAAVLLSYVLRSLLFGLGLADAGTFAVVSALFLLIAFVAAYMPSRRALRVDPVVALRAE